MESVEKFAPSVAALLVVDLQNDFCHPDGVMAAQGRDVSAIPPMTVRLHGLLQAARTSGMPVVWVRTTHDERTNTAAWLARRGTTLEADDPPESTCRPGTWGAEFYELAPLEGEPVVVKHRYSAFSGTALDWVLRAAGRRSLLVTGVATETCVESTVRDGLFHDYHVNVVADCCASWDRAGHEGSLANVRKAFGLVTSRDDLIAQWASSTTERMPLVAGP